MLRIDLSDDALEFLRSLPAKHARQIAERLQQLAHDPTSLPVKELKGSVDFFRLSSGEYRVIYRVEADELRVWLIGKRTDDAVYKRFERRKR